MSKTTRKAIVKSSKEEIEVYKLSNGHPTKEHVWNRYYGDKISMEVVAQKKHTQTYKDDELTFLN